MALRYVFSCATGALCYVVLAGAASAAPTNPGAAIAQTVGAYQKATHTPGVAVALYDPAHFGPQGSIFPFGVASLATHAPISAATVFQIGSITKVYDTTLLAVAYGKRYASRTTTAYSALKNTAQLKGSPVFKTVTLEQLASHTAGFPDSASGLSQSDKGLFSDGPPPQTLVSYWNSFKPKDPPGKCYRYSDTGFVTLGYAIADLYPAPLKGAYNKILQAEIAQPLGLRCTSGQLLTNCTMATGYHDTASRAVPVQGVALDIKSNATDMLKFLEANLGTGAVTQDPTLSDALKVVQTPIGTFKSCDTAGSVTIGLAWAQRHLTAAKSSPAILVKDGATPLGGMSAAIVLVPSLKIGAVVLTNGVNDKGNKPNPPAGQPRNPTSLAVVILRELVTPADSDCDLNATQKPPSSPLARRRSRRSP